MNKVPTPETGMARKQAADALTKALVTPWRTLKLDTRDRFTQETLNTLGQHRQIAEVDAFLAAYHAHPTQPVDSRQYHYLRRKYVNCIPMQGPEELDALIRDVLTNPASLVYKPGSRYRVVAPDQRIVVLVDEKGIPVSLIFQPDTSTYGAPLCTIRDLLD